MMHAFMRKFFSRVTLTAFAGEGLGARLCFYIMIFKLILNSVYN